MDYYRFEAKAGQEVGVQILTDAIGSKLKPLLELTDADGRPLDESDNGLLGYTCPAAGVYAVGVRDRDYRGDATMFYRLNIGDIPIVTGVFPLGIQRGTEADVQVEGVYLGPTRTVHVKAPADAAVGGRLPVPLATPNGPPLGDPSLLVGEFPEGTSTADGTSLPVPSTANGRIARPGAAATYRFTAKKGQRLLLEVNARRLGSPLDSTIEILDAAGKPLPRAVLRCMSKTYVMFRDHDSAGPGIRIEKWNDLAVNDYLLVGEELMRINQLAEEPRRRLPVLRPRRPAPRLPRHDADVPPAGAGDVQGFGPPAGHDVPAQRPAGGDARTGATTTAAPASARIRASSSTPPPTAIIRCASPTRAAGAARTTLFA